MRNKILFSGIILGLVSQVQVGMSAEYVSFISGPIKRTVSIRKIESLANNGKTDGLLKDMIQYSKNKPEKISLLLNQSIKLKLLPTSRLLYSRIGNVLIRRVSKVIYPLKGSIVSTSIPAFRAAVINGIVIGNGELSMLTFLKAYPNKTLVINVGALTKVVNKIESISDLVKFFSNSPLEPLSQGNSEG